MHWQPVCGPQAPEHAEGLFILWKFILCASDGLRALHVPSFLTLLFDPNHNKLVLKAPIVALSWLYNVNLF